MVRPHACRRARAWEYPAKQAFAGHGAELTVRCTYASDHQYDNSALLMTTCRKRTIELASCYMLTLVSSTRVSR